ncbi:hypothetical protein RFI_04386, partial [Reticulomyxa filosa]
MRRKKARIETLNEYKKKCNDLVPHLIARQLWKMIDFDILKTFVTEYNELSIQKELLYIINNATMKCINIFHQYNYMIQIKYSKKKIKKNFFK